MRKIWNHAPYPVWSLVTRDEKGDAHMNICTYVTPISMHPKEFIIGVYYGTATYDHVVRDRRACLQLLSKDQIAYVPLLGKKSAKKHPRKMQNKKITEHTHMYNSWTVLEGCIGYIDLEIYDIQDTTADHAIAYARVIHARTVSNDPVLTLVDLYDAGVIG